LTHFLHSSRPEHALHPSGVFSFSSTAARPSRFVSVLLRPISVSSRGETDYHHPRFATPISRCTFFFFCNFIRLRSSGFLHSSRLFLLHRHHTHRQHYLPLSRHPWRRHHRQRHKASSDCRSESDGSVEGSFKRRRQLVSETSDGPECVSRSDEPARLTLRRTFHLSSFFSFSPSRCQFVRSQVVSDLPPLCSANGKQSLHRHQRASRNSRREKLPSFPPSGAFDPFLLSSLKAASVSLASSPQFSRSSRTRTVDKDGAEREDKRFAPSNDSSTTTYRRDLKVRHGPGERNERKMGRGKGTTGRGRGVLRRWEVREGRKGV
jgi:hypothetical protein